MNFQEFLARKRALALVEHMNTLSESDAQELFDSLDEATIEFIEAVLNEGSRGVRRARRLKNSLAYFAGVAKELEAFKTDPEYKEEIVKNVDRKVQRGEARDNPVKRVRALFNKTKLN